MLVGSPQAMGEAGETSAKERILTAALELARRDEGEVSSREVARKADVNVALINYHFGNRDGLIQACVESYYAQIRQNLVALVPQYSPERFPEVLDAAVRKTLAFMRENRALARLVLVDFVQKGQMREQPRDTEDPLLSVAVEALSRSLDADSTEIRYRLKTIVLLCGRYVVISEDELARVSALTDPAQAWTRLEDHIVGLATALLCSPSSATAS